MCVVKTSDSSPLMVNGRTPPASGPIVEVIVLVLVLAVMLPIVSMNQLVR